GGVEGGPAEQRLIAIRREPAIELVQRPPGAHSAVLGRGDADSTRGVVDRKREPSSVGGYVSHLLHRAVGQLARPASIGVHAPYVQAPSDSRAIEEHHA